MIPLPCPWCGLEWNPGAIVTNADDKVVGVQPVDGSICLVADKKSKCTAVYCPRCNALGPSFSRHEGPFNPYGGPRCVIPWEGFAGWPRRTEADVENGAVALWNERVQR